MPEKVKVQIQREIQGSVVRWSIFEDKYESDTNGIVVLIDLSLTEGHINSVFNIAKQLESILAEASAQLRHDVVGN